jgi:glycosyltransferase involved in cell wall biosynthesis
MEAKLEERTQGMSIRVCFVAPNIWPVLSGDKTIEIIGGAEVRQTILARALVKAGYCVSVITQNFGQADGVVVDGIVVYRTHGLSEGIPGIRFFHPRLSSTWAAMKRADADIFIQSTASYLTAVVGAFSRIYARHFIYSGASDPDFEFDQTWKLFQRRGGWRDLQLYRWGLQLANGVVAQHRGQLDACRRWLKREAVEIPNCYVLPRGAIAPRSGLVLWVGTVKSLKRPELFLELARGLPHLRFRIVGGPGPAREACFYEKIKAEALSIPNLEFIGFVPFSEVDAHFNEASLFVNTSDYEGFPNTFLQSWARGIPTVTFFDCGARQDGRPIGSLCKDLTEMTQTIARLSKNEALWLQESDLARQYFQMHHTVEIAVERYSRLICQLIEDKRPS